MNITFTPSEKAKLSMGQGASRRETELNLAANLKPAGVSPLALESDATSDFITMDDLRETEQTRFDQMETNDVGEMTSSSAFGTGRVDNTTSLHRTRPRSSWWLLLLLFAIFVVLAVTTGILCVLDETCRVHDVPSMGLLLNNSSTDTLAVTALNTLIAMHFLLTANTGVLVKDYSIVAPLGMAVTAIGLYVMLYVSLIVPYWYIAIVPILCMVAWCAFAIYGLGFFYRVHPTKKLYYATVGAFILFAIPACLYASFSAIPYELVPAKDVAIFVCELAILVAGLIFVLLLVFHTRRVSYAIEIRKGYTII